jgi:hypothetical protein
MYKAAAIKTAHGISINLCAQNALLIYSDLLGKNYVYRPKEHQLWSDILQLIEFFIAVVDFFRGFVLGKFFF